VLKTPLNPNQLTSHHFVIHRQQQTNKQTNKQTICNNWVTSGFTAQLTQTEIISETFFPVNHLAWHQRISLTRQKQTRTKETERYYSAFRKKQYILFCFWTFLHNHWFIFLHFSV